MLDLRTDGDWRLKLIGVDYVYVDLREEIFARRINRMLINVFVELSRELKYTGLLFSYVFFSSLFFYFTVKLVKDIDFMFKWHFEIA